MNKGNGKASFDFGTIKKLLTEGARSLGDGPHDQVVADLVAEEENSKIKGFAKKICIDILVGNFSDAKDKYKLSRRELSGYKEGALAKLDNICVLVFQKNLKGKNILFPPPSGKAEDVAWESLLKSLRNNERPYKMRTTMAGILAKRQADPQQCFQKDPQPSSEAKELPSATENPPIGAPALR